MNTKSFITSSTITLVLISFGFLGSILLDKCKNRELDTYTVDGNSTVFSSKSWDYATQSRYMNNDFNLNNRIFLEYFTAISDKINPRMYEDLQNPIDSSKGAIVYLNLINKTIKDSLMKVKDRSGNLMFEHADSFNIYTSFSRIKPTYLYRTNPYRNKLVKELNNYHKDAFDSLLSLYGRDTTAMFLNEFSMRWTTTQHIGYLSDTIESNFYSTPNNSNKIVTQFDVSAVCPPVCPK